MYQSFSVPMSKKVAGMFLFLVAVSAGAATWSFRSGFLWSGICILAVAAPLALLYWFMLFVNPSRTKIEITDEGLLITAPPFITAAVPFGDVSRVFEGVLGQDERLSPEKGGRGMAFFGYRSGTFKLKGGKEAIIVARGNRIVGVQTAERLFLLGPKEVEKFAEAVEKAAAGG